jgi:hypothetical protein
MYPAINAPTKAIHPAGTNPTTKNAAAVVIGTRDTTPPVNGAPNVVVNTIKNSKSRNGSQISICGGMLIVSWTSPASTTSAININNKFRLVLI